jgi:3-oxoacyl-[acyl-carrier-protein] synthase II
MSCASGTIAIGDGFREIRDGYADVMLCGAAEAPLAPLTFGAFAIIRAMSTRNDEPQRASRPFDRDRDGFVMGEGGAVLVLEELERARARGAHIYAELVGYGNSNDAHHMTAPRPDGSQAARSMQCALADGHIAPTDVEYVNAHGSSTPLNDPTETLALKQVFGDHARRLQGEQHQGVPWPRARRPVRSRRRFARWPWSAAGFRRRSISTAQTRAAISTTSRIAGERRASNTP